MVGVLEMKRYLFIQVPSFDGKDVARELIEKMSEGFKIVNSMGTQEAVQYILMETNE
jgi:hypothetical protein